MEQAAPFVWKFQRLGGMDHVRLQSAEELARLQELDPKLWAALSCPASGLEFDAETLVLLDSDQDGRIRIPEVLAAVGWLCDCLKNPAAIVEPASALPLDQIRDDTESGRRLLESARIILRNLGKPDAGRLSREDVAREAALSARNLCNGDGIVPPLPEVEADVRDFIRDALAVMGGVVDAGGQPGINADIAAAFVRTLTDWEQWKKTVDDAPSPLGGDTAEAWGLMERLKEKIDDYFLRCDLAAFAPTAAPPLNAPCEAEACPLRTTDRGVLDMGVLEHLPLSRIEADRPLQLASGLNPFWRESLERFFALVRPLLSQQDRLTREDWEGVRRAFAPYGLAMSQMPGPAPAEVALPPSMTVDKLGAERIGKILGSELLQAFNALADQDASTPAAASDMAAVERLVLYYRHLYRLLVNFVSFHDFYSLKRKAIFQAGSLYLDGRCCTLCLPVGGELERHAAIASFSRLYLVYCECRRKPGPADEADERTMHIVAAMTAGDDDLLMEGRNGVYVDRAGVDWHATVVKIVTNPISLRQSVVAPYKRFGRMVTEQIARFASAKDKGVTDMAASGLDQAKGAAGAPPPEPGQPFDIGKSVGILAAIGLALGALGTALASITGALFALRWWQYPLVLLGLFLLISGPSLVLAWLKLRKRTLEPLLDASGWAVNSAVRVNFALGRALTATAALPPNAIRSHDDPLRKPRQWPLLVLLLAVLLGAGGAWLWFNADRYGFSFFSEQQPPGVVTAPEAPAGAAASPGLEEPGR